MKAMCFMLRGIEIFKTLGAIDIWPHRMFSRILKELFLGNFDDPICIFYMVYDLLIVSNQCFPKLILDFCILIENKEH